MEDVSHPPPAARSAAAPTARAWLTPRSGARVSVLGVALVLLALPMLWFPPQQHGFEVVLWLTLGGRSGGGWIGVGTVIAALLSNVSALRQPGLPRPTWVLIGFLLVTLYLMGVLPGFWEAAGAGPDFVIAPGYWVALAGVIVLLLGGLVQTSTVLRAPRQRPSSLRPHSRAVGTMSAGRREPARRRSSRGTAQRGARRQAALQNVPPLRAKGQVQADAARHRGDAATGGT